MNVDGIYFEITQEFLRLKREERELIRERDITNAKINAKIDMIEDMLIYLNDILCKHGNHIYEHFEESEPQESEDKEEKNV